MNDLTQTIQSYFNQAEIKNNFSSLVQKYFADENQKQGFLTVFKLVEKGEFNSDDLAEYMSDWLGIEIERALEINKELFDYVYGDVYDELQELYEEKRREEAGEVGQERVEEVSYPLLVPTDVGIPTASAAGEDTSREQEDTKGKHSGIVDLSTIYHRFSNSSFFQNAKQAGERLAEQTTGNWQMLKDLFYQSINAGDRVKVVGCLRVIFSGGVRKFFESDRRYLDFMQKFLSQKHKNTENTKTLEHWSTGAQDENSELPKFLADPANKKYVVLFIRLILEKKLKLGESDSATIGIGLGSLSRSAGESEYEDVAYGDEGAVRFVWWNF